MNVTEIFQTWHDELAAELDLVTTDLATAIEQHADAIAARNVAMAQRSEVAAVLAGLQQPVPSAIAVRVQPFDRAVNAAEGQVSQLRETMAAWRWRADDLAEAVAVAKSLLPELEPAEHDRRENEFISETVQGG